MGDQEIPIGQNMTLVFKGDQGKTFVDFDCNGYREMGIQGEVRFSRNKLIPEA